MANRNARLLRAGDLAMQEPSERSFQAYAQPTASFPRCAAQCALLAEANHRTANQFSLLTSYIHLSLREFQRRPEEVQNLQLALATVEAKARALASLNRLMMPRAAPGRPIDISVILHEVCATFHGQVGSGRRVVDAITGACLVSPTVGLAVAQIVTEAIMNGLKHAYPEDQAGDITVRSATGESGEVLIEVVDRGVGGPPALHSSAGSGFGVRLMRALASQENIGLSFVAASPGLSVQLAAPSAIRID